MSEQFPITGDLELGAVDIKVKELRDEVDEGEDLRHELDILHGLEKSRVGVLEGELGMGAAHQMFLYGLPGSKIPIRNLSRLSKLASVPIEALEVMAPSWNREAMRLARDASPLFAMAANERSRGIHKKDLERMRDAIDRFEKTLPSAASPAFEKKYKMLMLMRKEWTEASGIDAAIRVSEAVIKMEAKTLIDEVGKGDVDHEDLSAFDV